MKVIVTIDDVRINSNLKSNQTLIFTEKSFFDTILCFTQSRPYPLVDKYGFYQLIEASYKSDRPINITGIDKDHSNGDCFNGSIVNGIREPILYSFALSSPTGQKIYNQPKVKLFRKISKSLLSRITFYLQDDDHESVEFNGETIGFTCQLIKL